MSTIDSLLKSAAPEAERPDRAVVDADVARGRAALVTARRRRASRISAGVATLAVASAAVAVILTTSGTSSSRAPGVHRITAGSGPGIKLVAYSGDQLPGFTVSQVPAGWQLSSSVSTALCITPDDGSLNNHPFDFEGKLCVLPQSVDELGLGPGDPVTVNGKPGRVDHHSGLPGALQLRYITTEGHTVDVQSPPALKWSDGQITAFATGVKVTEHIGVTHG